MWNITSMLAIQEKQMYKSERIHELDTYTIQTIWAKIYKTLTSKPAKYILGLQLETAHPEYSCANSSQSSRQ